MITKIIEAANSAFETILSSAIYFLSMAGMRTRASNITKKDLVMIKFLGETPSQNKMIIKFLAISPNTLKYIISSPKLMLKRMELIQKIDDLPIS